MRKIFITLGIGFVVLIIFSLGFNYFLKKQIIDQANNSCSNCKLEWSNAKFSFIGNGITFQDLSFGGGNPKISRVTFKVKKLHSSMSPLSFLFDEIDFGNIRINGMEVVLEDGDSHSPSPNKDKSDADKSKKFLIQNITIEDASFEYVRNLRGQKSSLLFEQIDSQIGKLGNFGKYQTLSVEASARTQLGKSGVIQVKVAVTPFSTDLKVDVDIQVRDQNLAALASFLGTNDGIDIKGDLQTGYGRVSLQRNKAIASVFAKYKDFDMSFSKTQSRSELLSVLLNLGEAVALKDENIEEATHDQLRSVAVVRNKSESVVGFILRGLKKAALSVAK